MTPMIKKSLAAFAVLATSMLPVAAQAGWCGCRAAPPRPFLGFLQPLVEAAPNVFLTEPTPRYYPRVTCCAVRTRHYTYIPGPEYGPLYVQPDLYPPYYVRPHLYPRVYRHYRHRMYRTYRHRVMIERAPWTTRRHIRHVKRHWNN